MADLWNPPNPARENALPHLPLERLKPAGKISGVITCNALLSRICHFIGNRTLPCAGTDCQGCAVNRRQIWEAYISIWTTKPSRHIITVLTPNAALELEHQTPDKNQLRGWWIDIKRHGLRPNGRVITELHEAQVDRGHLPPAPDLRQHMFRIWGLDPQSMVEDHPLWQNRFALFDEVIVDDGEGQRKAK